MTKHRRQELPVDLRGLAAGYEVVRELGRGSTSTVYLAHDHAAERDVAVKVIRASHLDDIEALARFEREAAILARLNHPNIVRLYATCALEDGRIALVMQLVRGRTLKSYIRDTGPLSVSMAEMVLRDIAAALEHAAQHGVVHRDIKPENIFIDEENGRALLADFGIARLGTSESTLTLTGAALGTPSYMSPEQIDGSALDTRSDLYSLGMTAYEMLTGEKPWAGDNLYTVIYRQKHEEMPPLRRTRPDLPPHIVDAVTGLIRKHRVARWGSPADLIAKLDEGSAGNDVEAGRVPVPLATADSPTVTFTRPTPSTLPAPLPDAGRRAPAAVTSVIMPPRRSRRRAVGIAAALLLVAAASGATMVMIDRQAELPIPTPAAVSAEPDVPAPVEPPVATTDSVTLFPELPSGEPGAPAARVAIVSGGGQRATAGDVLPDPIVVQAVDENGAPVPNARVVFRVIAGDGNVAPPEKRTDSRGRATAAWALGTTAGPNQLAVILRDGPQTPLRVDAIGVTGPPAVIAEVDSDAPITSESRRDVRFRVQDRNGNPVSGARVDMRVSAGGGSVAPGAATSDEDGIVRATWTLGADTASRLTLRIADAGVQLVYAPAPFRVSIRSMLVAGGTHTCTLDRGGVARCWGGNDQGQLGSGRSSRQSGSVRVLASAPLARIATGISHSCAIDDEGSAVCWGSNANGQLGTGDRTAHAAPAAVRTTTKLTEVVAGLAHTCALNSAGSALCWGAGAEGQIGDGGTSDRAAPAAVAGGHAFTSLTAGWRHTCGLTSQNVAWCWGSNAQGQLGDATTTTRSAPVRVAGGRRFRSISAGAFHTCGVATDGTVWCWGQNDNGQIGGSSPRSATPVQVATASAFTSVTAGAVHTCALNGSGEAWCWGGNNFGQLGNEGSASSSTPVRVASELRFTSLTSSGSHTCGRTSAGDFCWGYNVEGQLGDGTRTNRSRPVRVGGPD